MPISIKMIKSKCPLKLSGIFPMNTFTQCDAFPQSTSEGGMGREGGREEWEGREGFYFILPDLLAPRRTSILISFWRMNNNVTERTTKCVTFSHLHCISQMGFHGPKCHQPFLICFTAWFTWILNSHCQLLLCPSLSPDFLSMFFKWPKRNGDSVSVITLASLYTKTLVGWILSPQNVHWSPSHWYLRMWPISK